jgi:hypothetical protein
MKGTPERVRKRRQMSKVSFSSATIGLKYREKYARKQGICLSWNVLCRGGRSALVIAVMPTAYTPLAQEAEEGPTTPSSNSLQGPRPEVYYEEGPFDAPSSEDEGEELLKQAGDSSKSSDIEANTSSRPSNTPLWTLVALLTILMLLATGIGISAGWMYQGITDHVSKRQRRITMDHIFNGTFYADSEYLAWVPEGSQSRCKMSVHALTILQPETAYIASKNADT